MALSAFFTRTGAGRLSRSSREAEGAGDINMHDRTYFYSLYVREPGGALIEYASDGPGMLVDERHYTSEEITADAYWGHDQSAAEPLAAFIP